MGTTMLAQGQQDSGVGFLIFLLLVGGLLLPLIPASIAKDKGHSAVGFYFFGLLFFLPALIVALVIQPQRPVGESVNSSTHGRTATPGKRGGVPVGSTNPGPGRSEVLTQIAQLADLHDRGALSKEEFDAAKAPLLVALAASPDPEYSGSESAEVGPLPGTGREPDTIPGLKVTAYSDRWTFSSDVGGRSWYITDRFTGVNEKFRSLEQAEASFEKRTGGNYKNASSVPPAP
jgi:hypothetical protein